MVLTFDQQGGVLRVVESYKMEGYFFDIKIDGKK